ncbi:Cysteine-rich secretory protein family protein [Thermoflexibacter ruber]|uniref:Cysteine-rich secretory protein family protein n=2 Tax=Thermoflexibacter ruber TaxID=1003 RepID=A0A1I2DZX7_9BACT|nr:Cysteine-rich secretory protein family protein [Thermoflexibacter ruber]
MENIHIQIIINYTMKKLSLLIGIMLISINLIYGQNLKAVNNHCLSKEEKKLYNLINEYRKQKNLKPIPLSRSLSFVARRHVVDLAENVKKLTHGWSNCAYDKDNPNTFEPCMWGKPKALTGYQGDGYECAYGAFGFEADAVGALESWKESKFHNEVIVNTGIWKRYQWNALGVGIYKGFAVIWFGEKIDEKAEIQECK